MFGLDPEPYPVCSELSDSSLSPVSHGPDSQECFEQQFCYCAALRQCLRKSAGCFRTLFRRFFTMGWGHVRVWLYASFYSNMLFSTGSLQPMPNFKRYHKTVHLKKNRSLSNFSHFPGSGFINCRSRFQRSEWDPYYWTVQSQWNFLTKSPNSSVLLFFIRPVFIFNLHTCQIQRF